MKTRLIILTVLTAFSVITFAQTKTGTLTQGTSGQDFYWQIKVNFELTTLDPEAIQIGWIDADPTESFSQKFNMAYLTDKIKNAKDDKEKEMHINVEIDVTWNNLFSVVKGSDIYLLTKSGMTLAQSGTCAHLKTKKWLVSKVFYLDNKPYAYAIPFDIENGSKLEVTLDKSNLISLIDLYNKIKK